MTRALRLLIAPLSATALLAAAPPAEAPRLSDEQRVEQLLRRMALDEKIGQLNIDGMVSASSADIRSRGRFGIPWSGLGTAPAAAIQTASTEGPAR